MLGFLAALGCVEGVFGVQKLLGYAGRSLLEEAMASSSLRNCAGSSGRDAVHLVEEVDYGPS